MKKRTIKDSARVNKALNAYGRAARIHGAVLADTEGSKWAAIEERNALFELSTVLREFKVPH